MSDTVRAGVDRAQGYSCLSRRHFDTVSLGVDRAHVAAAGAWVANSSYGVSDVGSSVSYLWNQQESRTDDKKTNEPLPPHVSHACSHTSPFNDCKAAASDATGFSTLLANSRTNVPTDEMPDEDTRGVHTRSEQKLNDVTYNLLESHLFSAALPLAFASDTVGLGVDRAHLADAGALVPFGSNGISDVVLVAFGISKSPQIRKIHEDVRLPSVDLDLRDTVLQTNFL